MTDASRLGDNTGFFDKHGIPISVCDTVRYTVRVRVATRVSGRGVNVSTSPVYDDRDAVGVVKFGMWKLTVDEIVTYYIATDDEIEFTDYVEQSGRRNVSKRLDLVEKQKTQNLSAMLTKRLATECEVMGVEHD